nr:hypothetical protein [Paraburkholderia youngii]
MRELEEETTLVADDLAYLFRFDGFNAQHHVFFPNPCDDWSANCGDFNGRRFPAILTLETRAYAWPITQLPFGRTPGEGKLSIAMGLACLYACVLSVA